MRRSNQLLAIIILIAILAFIAWFFIPGASNWISNNLTILLTVIAIIILAFVGIRFVMEKVSTASRRTADIVLIIIAFGCLFGIYVVPLLPAWIKQNWIPIIITIAAICAISILAWKIINRVLRKSNKNGKKSRTPIPVEIQRQVFSRANSRCQWKGCDKTSYLEIHHIDNNPANNNINNLICLCPYHHKKSQGKAVRSWLLHDWSNGKY